jgi:glycosyltransferase involved in cell wall biosynthesis
MKTKLKIISNLKRLETVKLENMEIAYFPYPPEGRLPTLRTFVKSFSCDFILLNGFLPGALKLAICKWLIPFNRCKLVVFDVLLSTPRGLKGHLKAVVFKFLFKKIDAVFLLYRNTSGLQRYYGIAPKKFRYVPFKINQYELIQQQTPTDGGYIFCGGKTRRDFDTFFEAVRDLPYPVKVVTTSNDDIAPHGSRLDETAAPPNVEIVRLDGAPRPFIEYMAGARLVVMPIKPEICGAGIGVYLMAMALKKCVILSAGPGAEDVLTENQAIIVPAQDSVALREAIKKTYTDSKYRQFYEDNGYRYAMGLQGEDRLMESLVTELKKLTP